MLNELRVGTPFTGAGVGLLPIERVRIVAARGHRAHWFDATKEAFALVICEPEGPRAVDVTGNPVRLDALIGEVPGLGAALEKLLGKRPEPGTPKAG